VDRLGGGRVGRRVGNGQAAPMMGWLYWLGKLLLSNAGFDMLGIGYTESTSKQRKCRRPRHMHTRAACSLPRNFYPAELSFWSAIKSPHSSRSSHSSLVPRSLQARPSPHSSSPPDPSSNHCSIRLPLTATK
jgi:hypothetical protein